MESPVRIGIIICPEWRALLEPTLCDEPTRLAYD